ncbi:NAD(P)-binding protein [Artomyces pyxidatus]|uniref:NAD(P)-binding protein n=1 Tax=Artomyces pyxidatus TaxID=48021 RepID=A0ACB8T9Y5_9AGAM|nr:NAD(P)-binding protein [Artomyces pyxidatus]
MHVRAFAIGRCILAVGCRIFIYRSTPTPLSCQPAIKSSSTNLTGQFPSAASAHDSTTFYLFPSRTNMLIGIDEVLTNISWRHEHIHFEGQTYKGKVVLVTGASRGIGQETALEYARAGASLVIVSREQATLNATKEIILKAVPDAQVVAFTADVRDTKRVAEALDVTIEKFGRLDVLVANAGVAGRFANVFGSKDPDEWWSVMEVNIRGVYNFVHFSLPHLRVSKGYAVLISSAAAFLRIPMASDYCMSKQALGRIAEYIKLEVPEVKSFALHPGSIATETGRGTGSQFPMIDSLQLPAATCLYLTSGKTDYLDGRFVSANWDLSEVEKDWKEKIVSQNGLVSKLHIPRNQ